MTLEEISIPDFLSSKVESGFDCQLCKGKNIVPKGEKGDEESLQEHFAKKHRTDLKRYINAYEKKSVASPVNQSALIKGTAQKPHKNKPVSSFDEWIESENEYICKLCPSEQEKIIVCNRQFLTEHMETHRTVPEKYYNTFVSNSNNNLNKNNNNNQQVKTPVRRSISTAQRSNGSQATKNALEMTADEWLDCGASHECIICKEKIQLTIELVEEHMSKKHKTKPENYYNFCKSKNQLTKIEYSKNQVEGNKEEEKDPLKDDDQVEKEQEKENVEPQKPVHLKKNPKFKSKAKKRKISEEKPEQENEEEVDDPLPVMPKLRKISVEKGKEQKVKKYSDFDDWINDQNQSGQIKCELCKKLLQCSKDTILNHLKEKHKTTTAYYFKSYIKKLLDQGKNVNVIVTNN